MLRNFGTVRPIFIASKVAQDSKEKSHAREKIPRNYRAKCRGGVEPPPPGLIRLKGLPNQCMSLSLAR